jgi:hypothetical protein
MNATSNQNGYLLAEGVLPGVQVLNLDLKRLLSATLGKQLLGVDMSADLYAKNGYRMIATSAFAHRSTLEGESQRIRNICKIDPAAAIKSGIRTGYDSHLTLDQDDILQCLSNLQSPRQRILYDLFWPHISEQQFDLIKRPRNLVTTQSIKVLKEAADTAKGQDASIIKHALALIHHNQAIAHELLFACGEVEWSSEHWNNAMFYWADVLRTDHFWNYIAERIIALDDPRLDLDDLDQLRTELPSVILAFNSLFAQVFAKSSALAACYGHLVIMERSGLPSETVTEALELTVRKIADGKLKPLTQRVETQLLDSQGKIDLHRFVEVCSPVLDEAFVVRTYLMNELNLPAKLVETTRFDQLGEKILSALNEKLDFSNEEERLRSILYCMLVAKRLGKFPLSALMKQKLEKSLRNDVGILYRGFLPTANDFDPTCCWFIESELPDPWLSFELPVYKITETKGITVRWEPRRVLVPRSQRAAMVHDGRLKIEDLNEDEYDEESKALLAQIKSLKLSCDRSVQKLNNARSTEITQDVASTESALRQHDKRTADAATASEGSLAKIKQNHDRQVSLVQKNYFEEIAQARKNAEGPIAEAQSNRAKLGEIARGISGRLRLEIPLALIIATIFGGISINIAIQNPGTTSPLIPLTATVLGMIAGLAISLTIRRHRYTIADKAISEAKASVKRAERQIDEQRREAIRNLDQQAKRDGAKAKGVLKSIATERTRITSDAQKRQEKIRRTYQQEINNAEVSATTQTQKLQQRFIARIKGKPESAQKDFPAYTAAKAVGYQDGKGPSDYEVNRIIRRKVDEMINSLDPVAKVVLDVTMRQLSGDEVDRFLGALIDMPSFERNQKLRSLVNTLKR